MCLVVCFLLGWSSGPSPIGTVLFSKLSDIVKVPLNTHTFFLYTLRSLCMFTLPMHLLARGKVLDRSQLLPISNCRHDAKAEQNRSSWIFVKHSNGYISQENARQKWNLIHVISQRLCVWLGPKQGVSQWTTAPGSLTAPWWASWQKNNQGSACPTLCPALVTTQWAHPFYMEQWLEVCFQERIHKMSSVQTRDLGRAKGRMHSLFSRIQGGMWNSRPLSIWLILRNEFKRCGKVWFSLLWQLNNVKYMFSIFILIMKMTKHF
jgi:hypothetical protein